jgi:hypothetical protein
MSAVIAYKFSQSRDRDWPSRRHGILEESTHVGARSTTRPASLRAEGYALISFAGRHHALPRHRCWEVAVPQADGAAPVGNDQPDVCAQVPGNKLGRHSLLDYNLSG